MKKEILKDSELDEIVGGSWTYRIVATKPGYLDVKKTSHGYNSAQEARDAKDWLVRELTWRGYTIRLQMVYKETED